MDSKSVYLDDVLALIDAYNVIGDVEGLKRAVGRLNSPPEPKKKTSRWDMGHKKQHCVECGYGGVHSMRYCPHCGAYMENYYTHGGSEYGSPKR